MLEAAPQILREIQRRKTFAIISHPDAGKTTITEKLLLFGGAIHMAGVVKAKRAKQFATSDWMELEKQRGISIASSVMQFPYADHNINLLDTPGHQDFSEDTYRVLTAVDSALMVIDSSKGIERQTKKLFEVCRDRRLPIITFMNKCDLAGKDFFDLIDEVEKVLKLPCFTMTWPIGQGRDFKGVYDLMRKRVRLFEPNQKTVDFEQAFIESLDDPRLQAKIGEDFLAKLKGELELLSGAGYHFDREAYLRGEITPVFFGSAVNNFGVQELLDAFVDYAPTPLSRPAESRMVSPTEQKFTGLVFKIQANMDPKHRDRIAFIRICSGAFAQGMQCHHVRSGKPFRINNALMFMSRERTHVEEAFAGDIIGVHDRGNLMIGDTITEGEPLRFTGIPQFSPEIFCRVELKDPLKNKQMQKGLEQLSEEGASQVFRRKDTSEMILGLVGPLMLEVIQYRLEHEYGAKATFRPLKYQLSRWYHADDPKELKRFFDYYRDKIVFDVRDYPLLLIESDWEQNYIREKNPDIQFYSNLIAYEQAV